MLRKQQDFHRASVPTQVRMSADGDWGSPGTGARTDEDGAMPVFSDPMRDAKNSPTHSNFSAPENLQGAPLLPNASHTQEVI